MESIILEGGEWFTGSAIKRRTDLAEYKFKRFADDCFVFQSEDREISVVSNDTVFLRIS